MGTKGKKLKEFMSNLIKIFTHDIWTLDFENASKVQKSITMFFKWCYLVGNGFVKDKCLLRSSALTYTTILAIVPFIAVAFSILKGFGFQSSTVIRGFLLKVTAGRGAVADNIIGYINNTNVGALGAIGIGLLFITVISLWGNIEKSFNVIWGIKKGRSIGRKLTDYLIVTLICPLFLVIATSATASANTVIAKLLSGSVFIHVYKFLFSFVPYVMIWLVLTFLYSFIPNTNVKFKSALGGGILAGTIWQIAQWGYIHFQIGAMRANAIYGSFAQLPLFLMWVYISWIIVLLGAEITFALQNLKTYQKEAGTLKIDNEKKQKLAIKILLLLARRFETGDDLLTNEIISEKLNIPVKLVNEILFILEKHKLVIASIKENREYYSLIKSPEKIYINSIIKNLNQYKETDINIRQDKELKYIEELFIKMDNLITKSNLNLTLKQIVLKIK